MADRRLSALRRRLAKRRREFRFVRGRIHKLKAAVARRERALQKRGDHGVLAVKFLLRRAGWHESPAGSNDAPFLAHWRRALNMAWMRGQPWCGFACLAAYHYAAHRDLPADTVNTVAIANRARSGNGFRHIPFNQIRAGDLVVFNFGSGGPKHVGLARGPARGGFVPTVEANTSPGNGGSQANGGGIYVRTRSLGLVHTVARPK